MPSEWRWAWLIAHGSMRRCSLQLVRSMSSRMTLLYNSHPILPGAGLHIRTQTCQAETCRARSPPTLLLAALTPLPLLPAFRWKDANWHHIAITWDQDSGETKLYFDGESKTPFWRSDKGWLEDKDPGKGGVRNTINAKSVRNSEGALALGQVRGAPWRCGVTPR